MSTYSVRLSKAAGAQLVSIRQRIAAEGSPLAAQRLAQRIQDAVGRLRHAPSTGRPLPSGLRELVTVRPYVIRYRITGAEIVVVRIRHAARRPTE